MYLSLSKEKSEASVTGSIEEIQTLLSALMYVKSGSVTYLSNYLETVLEESHKLHPDNLLNKLKPVIEDVILHENSIEPLIAFEVNSDD